MRELALGMRLAVTGGRSARLRAALVAAGVGAGVVLLLLGASIPNIIRLGDERAAAREAVDTATERGPATLLINDVRTEYHGVPVRGKLLEPEGPRAPVPPGVARTLRPGEVVVSPALRDLLGDDDGRLLRERIGGTVVGTIGDDGLRGARELAFYKGSDDLQIRPTSVTMRIDHFGYDLRREPLNSFMLFILSVGVMVLLVPVAVFVAAAVRFGGEERDRRLAAVRLIGADRAMTARIAAGEVLVGALAGVVVGAIVFFALRPAAELIRFQDLSVFGGDIRPSAGLAVLVVLAVPVCAVIVSLLTLRRVVIEPLGVVRRGADARRRLWWRLLPLIAGGALLLAVGADLRDPQATFSTGQVSAGVLLVLVGITAVLPWLVDVVVARMRGGGPAWQLAVGRLRLDGGVAARVVSGVAVAVAGAIALQSVLSAGERESVANTGVDLSRAQIYAVAAAEDGLTADRLGAALAATPGVVHASTYSNVYVDNVRIRVGDCVALQELAALGTCRDGDVFVTSHQPGRRVRPGDTVRLGARGADRFRVPADARVVPVRAAPDGSLGGGVLATPGALPPERLRHPEFGSYVLLDTGDPDAVERVRNTMAQLSPDAFAYELESRVETSSYRTVRRGIFAGALAVLLLIGASLLVGGLEQLRERRPVLAALTAFGVPRATLVRSVLWQTAIPVALGLLVSFVVGLGLGSLLLEVANRPVSIDWGAAATMVGVGAAIVLLVTLLTAPAMVRLSRPQGLRTE